MFYSIATFEAILGSWLISGLARKKAARAGATFYLLLACVSGIYVALELESCGCFGSIPLRPEWIFSLDIVAFGSLFAVQRLTEHDKAPVNGGAWAVAVARVLIVSVACIAVSFHLDGALRAGMGGIASDPQQWEGHRLPLLSDTALEPTISQGDWFVVLYRPNCGHCRQLLAMFRREAQSSQHRPLRSLRLAFLNIASTDSNVAEPELFSTSESIVSGRVSGAHDYWMETPTVVRIDDGVVQRVWVGNRALQLAQRLSGGEN